MPKFSVTRSTRGFQLGWDYVSKGDQMDLSPRGRPCQFMRLAKKHNSECLHLPKGQEIKMVVYLNGIPINGCQEPNDSVDHGNWVWQWLEGGLAESGNYVAGTWYGSGVDIYVDDWAACGLKAPQ